MVTETKATLNPIFVRAGAPAQPIIFIDLDKLSKMKSEEISGSETLEKIHNSILEYEYGSEWGEAVDYAQTLSKLLGDSPLPEAARLVRLAQWVGWPFLSLVDELKMLTSNLVLALSEPIDLRQKLFNRLSQEGDLDECRSTRLKFADAFRANEEIIGPNQITVAGEPGYQKPQVQNWLADYDQKFPLAGGRASIEEAEYTNTDQNTRNFSKEQRGQLLKLLQAYDLLFFPDLQKDVIGAVERIIPGTEIKEAPPVEPLEPTAEAAREPQPLPPLAQVAASARTLLGKSGGENKSIFDALDGAVRSKQAESALGALMLLAQLRRLDDVLSLDNRFYTLVRDDLKISGQDDKVEGLRLNPAAPNFIARFLKVVLQDKLNIAEGEALSFTQKLAQLLALEGDKYGRIVIDDGKGGWKWNL